MGAACHRRPGATLRCQLNSPRRHSEQLLAAQHKGSAIQTWDVQAALVQSTSNTGQERVPNVSRRPLSALQAELQALRAKATRLTAQLLERDVQLAQRAAAVAALEHRLTHAWQRAGPGGGGGRGAVAGGAPSASPPAAAASRAAGAGASNSPGASPATAQVRC